MVVCPEVASRSRRPELMLLTLRLSGCASVVPKKLLPSTKPPFPVVLHPPAALTVDQLALVPLVIKNFPALPDWFGANALNPLLAVVAPVPPFVIPIVVAFQVPVPIVPKVVIEL